MPLAATRANQQIFGLSSIKAKLSSSTEFVQIPNLVIRDGSIKWMTDVVPDMAGRDTPYDGSLIIEFKVMGTKTTANHIKLLDTFLTVDTDWQVTAKDTAIHFDSSLITAAPYFGVKWKLVADARKGDRYVQYTLKKDLTFTDFDAIRGTVSASTPDVNVLDNLASLARTDIVTGGIRKIEFGAGAYDNIASRIKNAKFICESVGEDDSEGRPQDDAIKIALEAELMQASNTELAFLSTWAGQDIDWKVTFPDAALCTMDSMLGIKLGYTGEGNLEKHAVIPVSGMGTIYPSQWDGIWSA